MTTITTAHSMSLDGFIAGAGESEDMHASDPMRRHGTGGDRLFDWLTAGDTPSRVNPSFKMSAASAKFFDEGVAACGAVVTGRRTYDVSGAWGGRGPMPGLPLFVITHRPPDAVPPSDPPYTYVTDGIESGVAQAQAAAAGKNVVVMGASIVQQCITAGLLDELVINLVPVVLGRGVRLLDDLDSGEVEFNLVEVVDAPEVTHLTYRVVK
jgi:dihydrofolate reductase